MGKGIKIFVGVMVFLGILGGAFLLFAKKKPAPTASTPSQQTNQKALPAKKSPVDQNGSPTGQPSAQDRKALTSGQWQKCKDKTSAADTNFFWTIQISEGIPDGGTYAKGLLNGDAALPVRVIIKPGIQNADQLKARLVVGKTAFLRGTCTDVAPDGSVVLQAF